MNACFILIYVQIIKNVAIELRGLHLAWLFASQEDGWKICSRLPPIRFTVNSEASSRRCRSNKSLLTVGDLVAVLDGGGARRVAGVVVGVLVLELQGWRGGGGAALFSSRQVDVGVEACKKMRDHQQIKQ